jgi:hypothetical protein
MLVKHCAKNLFHEFGFWFEQRGPVKLRCFFCALSLTIVD